MNFSHVRLYDWTVDASGLILSGVGLREWTVELFEATRVDRVQCLDTQSKPPRFLLSLSWVCFKPRVVGLLLVPVYC